MPKKINISNIGEISCMLVKIGQILLVLRSVQVVLQSNELQEVITSLEKIKKTWKNLIRRERNFLKKREEEKYKQDWLDDVELQNSPSEILNHYKKQLEWEISDTQIAKNYKREIEKQNRDYEKKGQK